MLVLALQFSKGIADQNTAVAAERKLVPGEKGDPMGRLPQNGREDKIH
jgi:hypothetical protein